MGKLTKKTILITGGSGFIGKNLREYLSKKYRVLSPSHQALDLLNQLATENYFKKNKVDVVIYAVRIGGSRASEHEENALYKNLRMFFNLVRNKSRFQKMINLGSGAEYDKSRPLVSVKETDFDTRVPVDDYGFYKYACSKYIEDANKIINLRIFGIYGKYEDYTLRFISNAICKNIFGLPITMMQNVIFDYVYINDFVRIVDCFISHNSREKFYNIGQGKKIDLITVAQQINMIAEKPSKIIVKKSGLNREYTCDNSRLMTELKSFSFTDFNQSLRELYAWYQRRKHLLNKESLLRDKK